MYCPNCGAMNGDLARFCTDCGAPLNIASGVDTSATRPQGAENPPHRTDPIPSRPDGAMPQLHPFAIQLSDMPKDNPNPSVYYPKKKSKAPLIILIVFAVLLLTAAVVYALSGLGIITLPDMSRLFGGGRATVAETMAVATQAPTETPTAAPTEAKPTTAPKAKVTDGINRPAEDVKKDLEDLGFVVKLEEKSSDTIAKGRVISQSIEPGSLAEVGATITLYVSTGGTAAEKKEDYEQKLVVKQYSGSSATATLYNRENGSWVLQATYDAAVGANGVGKTSEGSKMTPEGAFPLGIVLCATNPNTKMSVRTVNSDTVIVDDTNYPSLYNRIMDRSEVPSGCSVDNTGRNLTNGTLNAMIYINFNGDGFSQCKTVGGGSAIGVRGKYGSLDATWADVDISASSMNDLLSRLDPAKNPHIVIQSN